MKYLNTLALGFVLGLPTGWQAYYTANGNGAFEGPSYSNSQRRELNRLVSRINHPAHKKHLP